MSDIATNPLLGLLQEQALLDDLQLEEVNDEVTKGGKSAFQVIQDFGHLDKGSLLHAIANHMGAMVVEVTEQTVTPELKEIINDETAKTYQCVPVAIEDGVLQVALVDPLDPSKIDEMGYVIPFPIQLVVADPSAVENALSSAYGASGGGGGLDIESGIADILKELGVESDDLTGGKKVIMSEDTLEIGDDEDSAPIVKFVNLVLAQAVQDRASDIHFEPFENEYKIRYRVDGALYEMAPPPKAMSGPIASRIKIMSNLNISESRLPQDGRISVNLGGKQIDLRVSTLPTSYGESVVLRVLDRTAVTLELETLGFPPEILEFTTHNGNRQSDFHHRKRLLIPIPFPKETGASRAHSSFQTYHFDLRKLRLNETSPSRQPIDQDVMPFSTRFVNNIEWPDRNVPISVAFKTHVPFDVGDHLVAPRGQLPLGIESDRVHQNRRAVSVGKAHFSKSMRTKDGITNNLTPSLHDKLIGIKHDASRQKLPIRKIFRLGPSRLASDASSSENTISSVKPFPKLLNTLLINHAKSVNQLTIHNRRRQETHINSRSIVDRHQSSHCQVIQQLAIRCHQRIRLT
ncbi:ATPase, T2SS/T4P/T4SS family [Verrucomicrobia bacterium]|nr:ATPase, T2SS/T4P/T4SS family [Verrucomicrobiota bacterium]